METPTSTKDIQDVVKSSAHVKVTGGGTKMALSEGATLSTDRLRGVLEYEASEFTFTALSGTSLHEIAELLGKHRQFMPFDPPLQDAGATLGGTVAAGLSGPGRFRYGGIRDFLLGVRLVTGEGRIVFGGSKVVKNAAGFDIPKLMVGGLGRMGVLVELTFKVFPAPESYVSLRIDCADLANSIDMLTRLAVSQFELACLDFEPPHRIWVRIGGLTDALAGRVERLRQLSAETVQVIRGEEDESVWRCAREFDWLPKQHKLVKIPVAPHQISAAEQWFESIDNIVPRRYSVGGNMLWIALPPELPADRLNELLTQLRRQGLALTGNWPDPRLGNNVGAAFQERLLSVFDPEGKLIP